jgi:hypothetical protein
LDHPYIQIHTSDRLVDLRNNKIEDRGAIALGKALQTSALVALDVQVCWMFC